MKANLAIASSNLTLSLPEPFNIESICEGLIVDGFANISGFLQDELIKALRKEIVALDKSFALKSAGIGRGDEHAIRKTVRSDKIHWIDSATLAQCQLQENLESLRLEINRRLMLGLFDVESHYAVYRKGDFYKRHVDSFTGQKNRILSMVIYLNKNWKEEDGGLLEVYRGEDSEVPFSTVIPGWGNAVIFLSEKIPHEVTPAIRTRYSIATWFRCNNTNPLI